MHLLYFIQEPWIVNCQLLSSLNLLIILCDRQWSWFSNTSNFSFIISFQFLQRTCIVNINSIFQCPWQIIIAWIQIWSFRRPYSANHQLFRAYFFYSRRWEVCYVGQSIVLHEVTVHLFQKHGLLTLCAFTTHQTPTSRSHKGTSQTARGFSEHQYLLLWLFIHPSHVTWQPTEVFEHFLFIHWNTFLHNLKLSWWLNSVNISQACSHVRWLSSEWTSISVLFIRELNVFIYITYLNAWLIIVSQWEVLSRVKCLSHWIQSYLSIRQNNRIHGRPYKGSNAHNWTWW